MSNKSQKTDWLEGLTYICVVFMGIIFLWLFNAMSPTTSLSAYSRNTGQPFSVIFPDDPTLNAKLVRFYHKSNFMAKGEAVAARFEATDDLFVQNFLKFLGPPLHLPEENPYFATDHNEWVFVSKHLSSWSGDLKNRLSDFNVYSVPCSTISWLVGGVCSAGSTVFIEKKGKTVLFWAERW